MIPDDINLSNSFQIQGGRWDVVGAVDVVAGVAVVVRYVAVVIIFGALGHVNIFVVGVCGDMERSDVII